MKISFKKVLSTPFVVCQIGHQMVVERCDLGHSPTFSSACTELLRLPGGGRTAEDRNITTAEPGSLDEVALKFELDIANITPDLIDEYDHTALDLDFKIRVMLTEIQRQVIRMVQADLTDHQICETLDIKWNDLEQIKLDAAERLDLKRRHPAVRGMADLDDAQKQEIVDRYVSDPAASFNSVSAELNLKRGVVQRLTTIAGVAKDRKTATEISRRARRLTKT